MTLEVASASLVEPVLRAAGTPYPTSGRLVFPSADCQVAGVRARVLDVRAWLPAVGETALVVVAVLSW